jgi:hypothetical protein
MILGTIRANYMTLVVEMVTTMLHFQLARQEAIRMRLNMAGAGDGVNKCSLIRTSPGPQGLGAGEQERLIMAAKAGTSSRKRAILWYDHTAIKKPVNMNFEASDSWTLHIEQR